MRTFEEILSIIINVCKNGAPSADQTSSPKAITIAREDLIDVMSELIVNPNVYFDSLSCVTGIDNGPAIGTMEVAYNLYSIPLNHHLMIRVVVPRETPEINSVCHLWRTADWLEREIFDMYGITFLNHPDLRRILMPADWEGFPLRKDYKHQAYYRDIKVEY